MIALASGLSYFDLVFQGRPRIIATGVVHTAGGVALVDPGPSSTLPALKSTLAAAGISMADVTSILITHIHLDHAGVTGTLVRERPGLRVFVHEKGAPHMVDPGKLVASATRLYGDAMDRLWGEVLPVPADVITLLAGKEQIEAGGRRFDVEYTPGHASHHVSFFDRDSGVALVGDTAGVKLTPDGFVLPPTPPPDVDLVSGLAKASIAREGTDEDREAWFADEVRRELGRRANHADTRAYELAGRFDLNWRGLARYWRKKRQ